MWPWREYLTFLCPSSHIWKWGGQDYTSSCCMELGLERGLGDSRMQSPVSKASQLRGHPSCRCRFPVRWLPGVVPGFWVSLCTSIACCTRMFSVVAWITQGPSPTLQVLCLHSRYKDGAKPALPLRLSHSSTGWQPGSTSVATRMSSTPQRLTAEKWKADSHSLQHQTPSSELTQAGNRLSIFVEDHPFLCRRKKKSGDCPEHGSCLIFLIWWMNVASMCKALTEEEEMTDQNQGPQCP